MSNQVPLGSEKVCIISNGEGDTNQAPQMVDKIFANDKVAKFNAEGELGFGRVAINRRTLEARIEWDEGWDENLEKNPAGHVVLTSKIGVFDRKAVGFGSKVTNGLKTGTVREKRFYVTAALKHNPKLVLESIPVESLRRVGNSRKDDKVVYNNEWLGLVVDTKAKVFFTIDKDGRSGSVSDDNYPGNRFPHPGEKIEKMSLAYLWDAEWEQDHWLWNLFKYLADPATIQRAEVDCMTIAWMGRIDDNGKGIEKNVLAPPVTLRSDQVGRVKYLHGRNWKYVRENEIWEYEVQKGDSIITYDDWVKKVSDNTFFGISDKTIDMEGIGQRPIQIDTCEACGTFLEPGSRIYLKIVVWRSVVDVDWDDGTFETLPVFAVKPHQVMDIIPVVEDLVAGDLVQDKRESVESPKYGYVFKILNNGVVMVKWITPNPHGLQPVVSSLSEVSKFDLGLKRDYLYLRCLANLPTVVPSNGKESVDGVRVGVAVGIDINETKMIVRCPDEVERLVWAHDFKHCVWDVIYDFVDKKWITWIDPGQVDTQDEIDAELKDCPPLVLSLTPQNGPEDCRPPFSFIDIYPEDSNFATEQFLPRSYEIKFQFALETEFNAFKSDLPQGIWIEAYRCRADLITAVLQGPQGTPYEDHLFMFDFQLLHDFPYSPPDVYFHSYGLTVNPRLGMEGDVTIPEIYKGEDEDSEDIEGRPSIILETLLYIRDHVLVQDPYYLTHSEISAKNSAEYQNFVTLIMLELTESFLKHPPKNWASFAQSYYCQALPRLIAKYEKVIAVQDNCRGDYTGCAFTLGLKSRLDKLRNFLPSPSPLNNQ